MPRHLKMARCIESNQQGPVFLHFGLLRRVKLEAPGAIGGFGRKPPCDFAVFRIVMIGSERAFSIIRQAEIYRIFEGDRFDLGRLNIFDPVMPIPAITLGRVNPDQIAARAQ